MLRANPVNIAILNAVFRIRDTKYDPFSFWNIKATSEAIKDIPMSDFVHFICDNPQVAPVIFSWRPKRSVRSFMNKMDIAHIRNFRKEVFEEHAAGRTWIEELIMHGDTTILASMIEEKLFTSTYAPKDKNEDKFKRIDGLYRIFSSLYAGKWKSDKVLLDDINQFLTDATAIQDLIVSGDSEHNKKLFFKKEKDHEDELNDFAEAILTNMSNPEERIHVNRLMMYYSYYRDPIESVRVNQENVQEEINHIEDLKNEIAPEMRMGDFLVQLISDVKFKTARDLITKKDEDDDRKNKNMLNGLLKKNSEEKKLLTLFMDDLSVAEDSVYVNLFKRLSENVFFNSITFMKVLFSNEDIAKRCCQMIIDGGLTINPTLKAAVLTSPNCLMTLATLLVEQYDKLGEDDFKKHDFLRDALEKCIDAPVVANHPSLGALTKGMRKIGVIPYPDVMQVIPVVHKDPLLRVNDLSSGIIEFLNSLIAYSIIHMTKSDYQRFVELYHCAATFMLPKQCDELRIIIGRITVQDATVVIRYASHAFAANAGNDTYTLLLMQRLKDAGVSQLFQLTSHQAGFLKTISRIDNPIYLPALGEEKGVSLENAHTLIRANRMSTDLFRACANDVVKPNVRLLTYVVDDKKSLLIYSEGIIGFDTLWDLATQFNISYRDATIEDLIDTLNQINQYVVDHLDQLIATLPLTGTVNTLKSRKSNPFAAAICSVDPYEGSEPKRPYGVKFIQTTGLSTLVESRGPDHDKLVSMALTDLSKKMDSEIATRRDMRKTFVKQMTPQATNQLDAKKEALLSAKGSAERETKLSEFLQCAYKPLGRPKLATVKDACIVEINRQIHLETSELLAQETMNPMKANKLLALVTLKNLLMVYPNQTVDFLSTQVQNIFSAHIRNSVFQGRTQALIEGLCNEEEKTGLVKR